MIARHRRSRALVPLLALAAAGLSPTASVAAPAETLLVPTAVEGACPDDSGVTVVVDRTDLGGDLEVGCAPGAPESGAQALADAGFTATRDDANMVCAIDSLPDPCPTEFEGSWWSYWSAGPEGAWESYAVGPDDAEPAPGSVEGWRYFDGSAGPQVDPVTWVPEAPADAGEQTGAVAAEGEEPADGTGATADEAADATEDEGTATEGSEDQETATDESDAGSTTPLVLAAAAVVLLAVAIGVLLRRRRDGFGPPGQD